LRVDFVSTPPERRECGRRRESEAANERSSIIFYKTEYINILSAFTTYETIESSGFGDLAFPQAIASQAFEPDRTAPR
jgi:hypothetical protein